MENASEFKRIAVMVNYGKRKFISGINRSARGSQGRSAGELDAQK